MSDSVVNTFVFVLKALSYVVDLVTWLPYFIIQRPDKVRARSDRQKALPVSGSPSDPWRSVDVPDGGLSTTMFPGCETLPDLFNRACRLYGSRPCLGTREVLAEEEEKQPNGKVFKKLVLGKYMWQSFDDVACCVDNLGSGLLALGQKQGSMVVIFAETRAEWMISAQACFKNNFRVVTLYATLGVEAIIHGITETSVTHVITSLELLPKFENVLEKTPSVTHIIVMGATKAQLDKLALKKPGNVTVIGMEDVGKLGAEPQNKAKSQSLTRPRSDDIAVIMYTSGSTGLPKGVLISHRNLLCGTSGQSAMISCLGEGDTYLAYLPLAHVLELSAELSCLSKGTRLGYSSPNTLTDKSSKIKRGSQGDAAVLKPTLVAFVPVIMDRIYKNVWEKINSGTAVERVLFHFAYDYKLGHIEQGFDTPLLNKVVFKKTSALLGGSVRMMLCGGAPLSGATQRFMNVCFCCPVLQGYGLTETCGAGTVMETTDISVDRVGPPVISSEIRLRDWDEGNYKSSNKPFPQGEILIGGGNVTMGYFKNPEKTAEDFITIDGMRYFCTGDIGQFDADGSLRIIDRKKDLVKLQHGEYVSLAQVETVLKMSPIVEQICIIAHSDQSSVVALVVPNQALLESAARDIGAGDADFKVLCKDVKITACILKQLQTHGLKSKLPRTELPSALRLFPEPWIPETGLVTDAFKLKRKNIDEHFKTSIDEMYSV